jgi:hypothetical protein
VTCADPLPEAQVADATGHVHTLMVAASVLNSTTDQTIDTGLAMSADFPSHMHAVTLTVAMLGILKAGGSTTVTSTLVESHLHMFLVSCHGLTDAGATD